ncbi:MAG: Isoprenyl transferase [Bacteroidota bacterium]|nr:Isoprenyl transferase [Bacteroidota bacterium]
MDWKKNQGSDDKAIQQELIHAGNLPAHLAIIMDGNGRWAVERGQNRIVGHHEGIESVRDIVKAASQVGIKYLTLYAFSIENWKRPATEVGGLMKLLELYLRKELSELHENNVRVNSIGKLSSLPKIVQKLLHKATEKTKDNSGLTLTLALSYSGRWDIVRAVQMVALDVRRGKVSPEDIDEEMFSSYLQTYNIPDPDLMIRSSGEMRLSNFLLWEMAYSEIHISTKYWPDFRRAELYEALRVYQTRERRFGKTSAQLAADNQASESDSYIKRVVNAIKSSSK